MLLLSVKSVCVAKSCTLGNMTISVFHAVCNAPSVLVKSRRDSQLRIMMYSNVDIDLVKHIP